jgi:hypothetical protein
MGRKMPKIYNAAPPNYELIGSIALAVTAWAALLWSSGGTVTW